MAGGLEERTWPILGPRLSFGVTRILAFWIMGFLRQRAPKPGLWIHKRWFTHRWRTHGSSRATLQNRRPVGDRFAEMRQGQAGLWLI